MSIAELAEAGSRQRYNMSDVDYLSPKPAMASKATIFKFAEEQRHNANLQNGFQLVDLVKYNKGDLKYIDFADDNQVDAIVVEPDNSFRIWLSSHTSSARDNFTIAHELGHLLIHWPIIKKDHPNYGMKATRSVDHNDNNSQRCEWEANWFAAAFLMPAEEFKDVYYSGVAADVFGVTKAAVEVRARSLNLT